MKVEINKIADKMETGNREINKIQKVINDILLKPISYESRGVQKKRMNF